jgi:glucuronokinase
MDFTPEVIKVKGYGTYSKIPSTTLPPLFLAYAADPSDSGRIHAPIKQRWLAGDVDVITRMSQIASQADVGLSLCTSKPYDAASTVAEAETIGHDWAEAFRSNFDLRRSLFGAVAHRISCALWCSP